MKKDARRNHQPDKKFHFMSIFGYQALEVEPPFSTLATGDSISLIKMSFVCKFFQEGAAVWW